MFTLNDICFKALSCMPVTSHSDSSEMLPTDTYYLHQYLGIQINGQNLFLASERTPWAITILVCVLHLCRWNIFLGDFSSIISWYWKIYYSFPCKNQNGSTWKTKKNNTWLQRRLPVCTFTVALSNCCYNYKHICITHYKDFSLWILNYILNRQVCNSNTTFSLIELTEGLLLYTYVHLIIYSWN